MGEVHLPEGKTLTGSKWIFTIKLGSNGQIKRYKTRLVVQCHNQTCGVDYEETFAHVVN